VDRNPDADEFYELLLVYRHMCCNIFAKLRSVVILGKVSNRHWRQTDRQTPDILHNFFGSANKCR